uniref:Uncharacterized protein n=1 Tax=Vespula pensylvanica TaxID=30213 RepID=A0A834UFE3_VESPE|nr:hypothetical protein H0235_003602 [Vespula pensylvanica]
MFGRGRFWLGIELGIALNGFALARSGIKGKHLLRTRKLRVVETNAEWNFLVSSRKEDSPRDVALLRVCTLSRLFRRSNGMLRQTKLLLIPQIHYPG